MSTGTRRWSEATSSAVPTSRDCAQFVNSRSQYVLPNSFTGRRVDDFFLRPFDFGIPSPIS